MLHNNPNLSQDRKVVKELKDGKLKIAIYGLGHVGAPLAAVWLRAGGHVIGVDKSKKVLSEARKGRTTIPEPNVNQAFRNGIDSGRFKLYDDPIKASRDSYFKMICVPVLSQDQELSADLTAVSEVATMIGKGLKKNDVVSLNPSVPPGTTEDVVIPIVERESGLNVTSDFCMIYNPERIYEGRAVKDIEENYPAILSSIGPKSKEIAFTIYSFIFKKGVLLLDSIRTAEAEKLFEGVYRDVNIALANEMAKFCEAAGIDFWQARDAANSQPFCHIHKPGIGVGGACIPVYPQFVLDVAKKINVLCEVTNISRAVNDGMPSYCVRQAIRLLKFSDLPQSTITILGLAFRGDVSDTRLSPTYSVIRELQKFGVKKINIHDSLVSDDPDLSSFQNVLLTSDLKKAIKDSNLIILSTDHHEYKKLGKTFFRNIPVYDGRGLLDRNLANKHKILTIGQGNSKIK
ncbi:MAG: nucleotide sugar dehydrogenase [Nitrososphaeraceae archaeon]|jgi:nucleotide sugar dehydrogenase|nr:nucleotide sugar dehydrogenase [Nitrososphaeraceae archaeon]